MISPHWGEIEQSKKVIVAVCTYEKKHSKSTIQILCLLVKFDQIVKSPQAHRFSMIPIMKKGMTEEKGKTTIF